MCVCITKTDIIKKIVESEDFGAHFERKEESIIVKGQLMPQKPDSALVEAATNGDADSFTVYSLNK